MPVDYDSIRTENIERYGWDPAILHLLGRLYSNRTHFIFELIQNAEDARATELIFELFDDRLEVRHDGRPFTEADVRGICGVGKSTKVEDLTQIGKFGIGFKSVYSYTQTPRVHSGDEHFRIESYVRPCAEDPTHVPSGETLFVFPFDHEELTAETAIEEISSAFNKLELGTLLFLRSLKRLCIRGVATTEGVLERTTTQRTETSRHVALTESFDDERQDEEWFVWDRQVDGGDQHSHRIEIAFGVSDEGGRQRIVECEDSPLVVYFPTEKETFLGFLIQGPYRTTPARDNIPQDDAWNQRLVRETALLLTDVLTELREERLLTVDVLQALPLDRARFQPDGMFRPLFNAVRDAFLRAKLIPLADGGHGDASELKLARGAGLRELLSPAQLGMLYDMRTPVAFAHHSITEHRTPRLWRYLREEIGVDEVTPDVVVARLTRGFLRGQSDEWFALFYVFVHQNPSLWREPRWHGDQPGIARNRPIIRREDGSHVRPFNSEGVPNAYLPGLAETRFPTVRRAIADVPIARQFLEALRLTEPDTVAEVLEYVLPRYSEADPDQLDPAQHEADLDRIAQALDTASAEQREQLRKQLQSTAFIVGENARTNEARLRTPGSLYLRTRELEDYFEGNPGTWFARDIYQLWANWLRDLGLRDSVQVEARRPNRLGHVVTVEAWGLHERGLDGFDPAARIDGLEFALRHPTSARSEYVWNVLLAPNKHLLAGVVEKSGRQDFSMSTKENVVSPIGNAAREMFWIPDADAIYQRPIDLGLDDLPSSYKRDDVLAKAVGMTQPVIEEAGRQLGVSPEILRALRDHPDLIATIEREMASLVVPAERDDTSSGDIAVAAAEGLGFTDALSEAFDRPASTANASGDREVSSSSGAVANPALRRERVREAIQDDRDTEPAEHERFRRVPHRVWEAKDNAVKHFLLEQYGGRCQICNDTFAKRDGTPYFEGLYLASRIRGRWLDRPGNVLSLCSTCSAKFQHGPVEAPDVMEQITSWRTAREGGGQATVSLKLCGEQVRLRFTEKHLLELQEIITADVHTDHENAPTPQASA
jgi:hypothetical protein